MSLFDQISGWAVIAGVLLLPVAAAGVLLWLIGSGLVGARRRVRRRRDRRRQL